MATAGNEWLWCNITVAETRIRKIAWRVLAGYQELSLLRMQPTVAGTRGSHTLVSSRYLEWQAQFKLCSERDLVLAMA